MTPATVLFAGYVLSRGFGEQVGPAVCLEHSSTWVRAAATFEAVTKVESGRGFIAGTDVDVGRTLFVGAGYHYRDGGAWVKHAAWARAGVHAGPVRLLARKDLTTRNRVFIAELQIRGRIGRVEVLPTFGWGRFDRGSTGIFAQEWIGYRLDGP